MKRLLHVLLVAALLAGCKKETVTTVQVSGPNAVADKQAVGKSANALLSAASYPILNIEIQFAPGMKPQDQSIANLVNFLNTYLNKPSGINVVQKQVSSLGAATVTLQEVANFQDKNRSIYTIDNSISVYVLFADADYSVTDVAGISYWNTSITIFEKTIQAKTGGAFQASRTKVESGTLMHEFGHLLGLVNLGTPMVKAHEDAAHVSHCSNTSCLMYYATQTNGLMASTNNTIPGLDVDCMNDLRANGGK
jgi:nitrous oxide reductase accessory protein NosL